MAWRPKPRRARTDPSNPKAWATSDRNGMLGNAQDLMVQMEWRGLRLIPTNVRVYPDEWDTPQRQLGTIILSPDPLPILNARPEQYPADEIWPRLTQQGQPRYLQRSECSRSLQQNEYYNTGKF